ncbi:MAG: Membrane protein insertase YidC [candidate division WS6 bacterium OLB20]|uniref:Membrane protein insertase YidC n=1 Tax=candidate division WS6 bacterium OLB20 TaxID=1617426 RepID=A0A136LYU7_9BACT|nr:MAG: Membrane protein insertase YidC [candidate division WS6 bacterium OLB20]
MDIFHNFFYVPIFNILMVLYQLLSENLGLAILAVALVAKLVTYPLTRRQINSAEKNREFQERTKDVRKKYKNDQETLAKEMAKLQAEYLPGQLMGCLNLIIVIVLLIQVRNVVINLVNQGVHAFNQVAYAESLKLPEDSVSVTLPEGFEDGQHSLTYVLQASDGARVEYVIDFVRASDDGTRSTLLNELRDREANLNEEERANLDRLTASWRQANIAVYIPEFTPDPVVGGDVTQIKAFVRPPSQETIDYSSLQVLLDGEEVPADRVSYTQGTSLNFEFIGADLSLVATDIGFSNPAAVAPYVVIAVGVGVTQFFASRIQMGFSSLNKQPDKEEDSKSKKKKDKKDKKEEPEEPDFAEMMQSSTQSMMFIFPVLTTLMSLGFLGGGSIFPAGVSLFWTGQSAFVIIEQLITNRDKVFARFTSSTPKDNE